MAFNTKRLIPTKNIQKFNCYSVITTRILLFKLQNTHSFQVESIFLFFSFFFFIANKNLFIQMRCIFQLSFGSPFSKLKKHIKIYCGARPQGGALNTSLSKRLNPIRLKVGGRIPASCSEERILMWL